MQLNVGQTVDQALFNEPVHFFMQMTMHLPMLLCVILQVYRVYSNNQEFESIRLGETLSFLEDGKVYAVFILKNKIIC